MCCCFSAQNRAGASHQPHGTRIDFLIVYRFRTSIKKRGLLFLSLHPAAEASRIAHLAKEEQRRSPRRYVTPTPARQQAQCGTSERTPTVALLSGEMKFARLFRQPKNKASSKRLLTKCVPCPHDSTVARFCRKRQGRCKDRQKSLSCKQKGCFFASKPFFFVRKRYLSPTKRQFVQGIRHFSVCSIRFIVVTLQSEKRKTLN